MIREYLTSIIPFEKTLSLPGVCTCIREISHYFGFIKKESCGSNFNQHPFIDFNQNKDFSSKRQLCGLCF